MLETTQNILIVGIKFKMYGLIILGCQKYNTKVNIGDKARPYNFLIANLNIEQLTLTSDLIRYYYKLMIKSNT